MAIRKMDMDNGYPIGQMVIRPHQQGLSDENFPTCRTPARIFMRPTGVTE